MTLLHEKLVPYHSTCRVYSNDAVTQHSVPPDADAGLPFAPFLSGQAIGAEGKRAARNYHETSLPDGCVQNLGAVGVGHFMTICVLVSRLLQPVGSSPRGSTNVAATSCCSSSSAAAKLGSGRCDRFRTLDSSILCTAVLPISIEEKLGGALCGVGRRTSHLGAHGEAARAIDRAVGFIPDRLPGASHARQASSAPVFRSLLTRLRDQPRSSRKPTAAARRCKPRPRGELVPL